AHTHGEALHVHKEEPAHTHGEALHVHEENVTHTHGEALHVHEENITYAHESISHVSEGTPHHDHPHSHVHRGICEIRKIIDESSLTECARGYAHSIFNVIAQAESKAHGLPPEKVHFHEVGAVDSIVDVLSVAVCLDNLDITEVAVSELWEGQGTVRCQHGILPIPVPAVANIVQAGGLKMHISDVRGELVTPTGAAIAAAIRTTDHLPEKFSVKKIGLGAGKRSYEGCSGFLRAMLLEPLDKRTEKDIIWKLESNIDDCSGETLGHTMDLLLQAGARDVHYIPCFMKKNRPAWLLEILCREEDIGKLEQIIFRETTTIGIRRIPMEREILKRDGRRIVTSCGEAGVKICRLGEETFIYPEYEDLCRICRENKLSYMEAYQLVMDTAKNLRIE
ncbi:MAG: nickel pincer cofactor biosynthesis protein LarC, partial [Clostridiales bacterium]|nr:nickel pincer cofactor biosynthesis protein LarC [Clostridiales bacterium]